MSNKTYTPEGLKKMTVERLVSLAAETFGLTLSGEQEKSELVDEILAAQAERDNANTNADTAAETSAAADTANTSAQNTQNTQKAKKPKRKMYRLRIHSTEGPGGNDDVTVQPNGYVFQIKRDKDVEVPEEVIEILKNATITKFEQAGINKDTGEIKYREYEIRRYNFDHSAIGE